MSKSSYFDQAADTLTRAMKAQGIAEQGQLLEEALRLNRLALAEERAELAKLGVNQPSASPDAGEES